MNAGLLKISLDVLRTTLNLPPDVKFTKVRQSWDQERTGDFEVLVESPNLQETLAGNEYPFVKCTLEAKFCPVDVVMHIIGGKIENY